MSDDDATTLPPLELDDEGKKLQLEAEKAKYLETIAKASQGTVEARADSFKSVLPSVEEEPKGEVTLHEKAGAFGPWCAHKVIDGTAEKIAECMRGFLVDTNKPHAFWWWTIAPSVATSGFSGPLRIRACRLTSRGGRPRGQSGHCRVGCWRG